MTLPFYRFLAVIFKTNDENEMKESAAFCRQKGNEIKQ
jgi:hypothetical protein